MMAVCEAFIMTGQKMLKLSSDESGKHRIKHPQENLNSDIDHNYNKPQQQQFNQTPSQTSNETESHDTNAKEDRVLTLEEEHQDKISSTDEGLVCSSNENINDCKSSITPAKILHSTEESTIEDTERITDQEVCIGSSKDSGIDDKKFEQKNPTDSKDHLIDNTTTHPPPESETKEPIENSNLINETGNRLAMSQQTKSHLQKHSRQNAEIKSETIITFKTGYLNRKRTFEPGAKPTTRGRRGWKRVYVILQDLRIKMRNGIIEPEIVSEATDKTDDDLKVRKQFDPDDRPIVTNLTSKQNDNKKPPKPVKTKLSSPLGFDIKSTSNIRHCLAYLSTTYEKREFVFHLRLADRSEFLLQANSKEDMIAWIESINFAAACLSAPALPDAIVNSNSGSSTPKSKKHNNLSYIINRRPILPTSYTKLSYWEQLLDHEERLQTLKRNLDECIAQVSATRNADKRFKTQFIDKIANLKEDIERYGIYVDLMQKKSNSPEAMILSKHAKIVASLTPSKEMMTYVPL